MGLKLGVLMDELTLIHPKKDSTLAMMLAAQRKGWSVHYFRQKDVYFKGDAVQVKSAPIRVEDKATSWYQLGQSEVVSLASFDVILMRKDPPFDMDYIVTTYCLEHAERQGTVVVNKPASLRDFNEKFFTTYFPQCIPPTMVSADRNLLETFREEQQEIILKPLEGMGGRAIFRVKPTDPNFNVIVESLTDNGRHMIMAQKFIPQITEGDKRILLIDGEPVPYALARIPAKGEFRGNLAAGATGKGVELTERDRWICQELAPVLKERGLLFVGIDVIGDYLTEINITSPTCIRELDALYGLDIAGDLMATIEKGRG